MTLVVLLAACGSGSLPYMPQHQPRGRGVDTAVDAVDTDTGGDSHGDTHDSHVEDTDTGDSPTDSAVDTAVDACDPSPYITLDTGLDTGSGPAIEVRSDLGVVDARYVEDTTDDCSVSTVSGSGDPLLECLGTTLDLSTGYQTGTYTDDWDFEWVGDRDGDGYDDAILTGLPPFMGDTQVDRFVFYGAADRGGAGTMLDPTEVADALVDGAELRPIAGSADVNGDGLTDLIVASDHIDLPNTEAGVIWGDGSRIPDGASSLGVAQYWMDTTSAYRWGGWAGYQAKYMSYGSMSGYARGVFGVDLDDDGAVEVLFPEHWDYGFGVSDYLLAAVRGRPDLIPSGSVAEVADWTITQDEHCWYETEDEWRHTVSFPCWQARSVPVGDVDGDGLVSNAMMLGAVGVTNDSAFFEVGKRVALMDLGAFPACTYPWQDVTSAVLSVGDSLDGIRDSAQAWYLFQGPIPVGDLNGDGLDDLVVVAQTASSDDTVAWMLYGGERWLRHGGALESAPDRLEFPGLASGAEEWNWAQGVIQATDLDGDSIDELVVGGAFGVGSTDTAFLGRAHVDLIRGTVGGLRGVRTIEDATNLSLVGPPDSVMALPGRGRGDFDADGSQELLVSWSYRWWSTGFDGARDEEYKLGVGSLIDGSDLSGLW